jgi:hypothetical protein
MSRDPMKEKKLQIRNSTAEFLIFTKQAGEGTIEVRGEDETVWLTQKLMSVLFEVDVRTISEHVGNIYETGEQRREATVRKFRTVQKEGNRDVTKKVTQTVILMKNSKSEIPTYLRYSQKLGSRLMLIPAIHNLQNNR